MLYVCSVGKKSEPIGLTFERRIGIADTDDNTKETYTELYLQFIVQQYLDIEIVGLTLDPVTRVILDVSVYTPPRDPKELKLELLTGLSIKTELTAIQSISAGDSFIESMSVRLSDYGKKCSSRVLQYFKPKSGTLTLILDDNIKVVAETFDRLGARSIMVDVCDVTIPRQLELIYNGVLANFGFEHMCREFIIDSEDRRELYTALFCVSKYYTRPSLSNVALSQFRDVAKVTEALGEYLSLRFRKNISGEFRVRLSAGSNGVNSLRSLVSTYRVVYKELAEGRADFNDIDSIKSPMFFALKQFQVNRSVYLQLLKYIKFFSGNEESKQLFAEAATGLAKTMLDKDAPWNRG